MINWFDSSKRDGMQALMAIGKASPLSIEMTSIDAYRQDSSM